MKLLILNGPNLNLLGTREPEKYGATTLESLEEDVKKRFHDHEFFFFQSNHEGELIDRIHGADAENIGGIVFNPGGYSHTSVAIRDAMASVHTPVLEVHITNIAARESFRHHSITAGASIGQISGIGIMGYFTAIEYFLAHVK